MKLSHTRLANGLNLYVAPLPATKTVTVLVLVRAGSKYETKHINGLSHFLEHMFFKGTTKRPTALDITETLDRVGGDYNAFTDKERTGYYAKVDSKHLELAVDLVSDMLLNSLHKEEEIEKEKGVIQQEISMYLDNPMSRVDDVFENLLYGNQPAGWDIAGTKQGVAKLKRKDFVEYMNARYVANETFVVVAGNVSPSHATKLVNRYFGKAKKAKAPGKLRVKESQKAPAIKLEKKDTDQTHFQLGVRAFHSFDDRRFALTVLGSILGGNMSSRLFMSLREKHGLAYYVHAKPHFYSDTGYFLTQAGVPNKDIVQAVKIVMDEYETIRRFRVSPSELKKAKDYISGKTLIGLESSNAVADFIGNQALTFGKTVPVDVVLKKIQAVTASEILAVAKSIFKNERLNLAMIGPGGKESEIKRALKFKK